MSVQWTGGEDAWLAYGSLASFGGIPSVNYSQPAPLAVAVPAEACQALAPLNGERVPGGSLRPLARCRGWKSGGCPGSRGSCTAAACRAAPHPRCTALRLMRG